MVLEMGHFSKRWSLRFAQKYNKVGFGGGRGQASMSSKAMVFEILDKQAENDFVKVS